MSVMSMSRCLSKLQRWQLSNYFLVFGFFLVCGEACFVGVGFSPRHQEPTLAANTKHESGIYVCAR